jgi:myo-inositol-1(or 4)-monophosphatase
MPQDYSHILSKIDRALDESMLALKKFKSGEVEAEHKQGGDPVTDADRMVDRLLKKYLPENNDGWLSEETRDDLSRLEKKAVWIVDPLDGTREFVKGIPEWVVSIAYVVEGHAVAGGMCNPDTGERFLGAAGHGVFYNGHKARMSEKTSLEGALVPASRSEVRRGEWEKFEKSPIKIKPMGSVAYKLGLLSAGQVDANWTLVPKHEWDVAAGVALVEAAGGFARLKNGERPLFNNKDTLLSGLWAGPAQLYDAILRLLEPYLDLN